MTVLATTRYGDMECLSGDSVVSRSLVQYGEWAQLELELLAALIRPGTVVLDVGAFLGTHTLAFATMVGPEGVVHSFEPRAGIREVLRRNVERNGLLQVVLHACALGSRAERIEVPAIDLESEANFGGLALEGHEAAARTETIVIERLDDLAIDRLDFIKLDAEGMEADVLAGARRTLAHQRPLLFAECNDLERGSRTLAACIALGYRVYGVLSPAFNPANLRGQNENMFGDAVEASLLAVAPEKQDMLRTIADQLTPIASLDDLALLLLHKAQYPIEVLAQGAAATVLGTDYLSPVARRQQDRITELEHAVKEAYDRAQEALGAEPLKPVVQRQQERLTELESVIKAACDRAQEAERRAELAANSVAAVQALADHFQRTQAQAQQAQAQAERYRRSSLLYWTERLRQGLGGRRP
ncbi:FkbM family methyltransferase [Ramlibacter tataouinensis]|uniref:Methyltransferase FkbM domain-containing protein n=1 Tax=Ramlibacter tataouinensis (strain ATCC BAA-407 / DSM 14655 / LMG 21543 / TTB310) TaxID=365046 RepID=F5XYW8_RAMTT|nr:FkbM family methyltransferase [Ramlibacter tataouinensis]AEG91956.1 Conserved hypothetical protein [Ramlibacter tataouinensis TTB310]